MGLTIITNWTELRNKYGIYIPITYVRETLEYYTKLVFNTMILTLIFNDLISGKIIRDRRVMIFPAVLLVKCMINMVQKVWTPW